MKTEEIAKIVEHERKRAKKYTEEAENRIDPNGHPRALKLQARQMAGSLVKDFDLPDGEAMARLKEWSAGFYTGQELEGFMAYAALSREEKVEFLNSSEERAEKETYVKSIDPRARMTREELAEHDTIFDKLFAPVTEIKTPSAKRVLKIRSIGNTKPNLLDRWIIKKFLPAEGIGFIYGEPGLRKTGICINQGLAVALGIPWCGRKTKQGTVLYVSGEGSIENRVEAYLQHHNITDRSAIPFYTIDEEYLDMLNGDVAAIVAAAKFLPTPPILIYLDTLNSMLGGGDENGADMDAFKNNCRAIERATGAVIVVVHHPGKDLKKGLRGRTTLLGSADFVFNVTEHGGDIEITIQKLRRGIKDTAIWLHPEVVILGVDEDGESVTDYTLVQSTGRKLELELPKTGTKEAAGFEILQDISFAEPTTMETWRTEFIKIHYPAASPHTAKDAFNRIETKLREKGLLIILPDGRIESVVK